jgi:hypothetical protein
MSKKLVIPVLAGALAFAGGLLAPQSWQQSAKAPLGRVLGAKAAAPAAASAQTKQDKEAESKPVAYTSVQRPLTLPSGGRLALSLGLFASQDGAAERKQQLSNLGYETRLIAVRDENSATWYLLAAGSYDSDAAAESARATLGQQMNHGAPIGIVLLPPPSPPNANAPSAP